ncbi:MULTISPECIES: c-type cytochrome [unclassified Mesorhizobium]|uniref:c-type cytochrome n=1 Tax=unclassified Mesorhizobium TaxID=325217 RepID=UPI000FD97580|nr:MULTISPECIES: c-type cytochrome [unclassified Mesorhizobium]TGT71972.1 c-type cytochrome [Mesorhizobium sp. M2E.F.Ca.ET.166.01.1.1]TGV99314.1 c-type cytochrome [Mesorhizobium sp. M2E.F.Ca.ET.154.01.1.1]
MSHASSRLFARLALALGAAWTVASPALSADADLLARGKYIATASDCVACHTAPGGAAMAGGLPLATPIGPIMSTNITPSKENGIGNYTLEQFDAALRNGVRADGTHLYPAMPYTAYVLLSDADVAALYTYFMNGVTAVETRPPEAKLPFPFNIRLSMAAWNLLFLDHGPYKPNPAHSVEWNRGAYLVGGPAHCGTCHTPRNLFMAEKTSSEMAGADIASWHAPNITSDANSGVGGWSVEELVAYMRDGHAAGKSQAAGPMAEAIDNSLRFLTPEDLKAIAVYVKSIPAVHDAADTKPVFAWGSPSYELASIRGVALPQDRDKMSGPQLYDAYCATCHQADGQGSFDGGLPPLLHNTALGRENTNNLVMVMLEGVHRQPDVLMPGFAKELSDTQIATLGNYLIQHFGNPGARVDVGQAAELRAGGTQKSMLVSSVRVAIAVGALVLIGLIVLWLRRRRKRGFVIQR